LKGKVFFISLKRTFPFKVQTTKDGRPYLSDAVLAQRGSGAVSKWHPDIFIAAKRKRRV